MRDIDPRDLSVRETFALLQGAIAPRPIALVSTISAEGSVNLSPFSFFNVFGGNPPTVAFSPSRRQRDGSFKHTYRNLMATKECVIQVVTHGMVQQVSLASTEYPDGVNEFAKSGLTPIRSDKVKPPRVGESPFQMECLLQQMVPLGDGPGSGNLAICEVIRFHCADDLMQDGKIHPDRIDLVGRNGSDFYTRASGGAIFSVRKPLESQGMGYDQLPAYIRSSHILSGNDLGQLANIERLPSEEDEAVFLAGFPPVEADPLALSQAESEGDYRRMFQIARGMAGAGDHEGTGVIERAARCALRQNDVAFAWKALLSIPQIP
jgi:flavin reductase (DIM6/NTAB) family NADH-FMN oxidoreductase RutF